MDELKKNFDVVAVAQLARLNISPTEAAQFSEELVQVLETFAAIAAVDTSGVVPMTSPLEEEAYRRMDTVEEFEGRDQAIASAPELQGSLFKVPSVL